MSLIQKQIEAAYKKKILVCVCLRSIDWDNRIIGYIRKIHASNKFDLEIIDEFGQEKNVRTVLFASVKSLEIGGVYNGNIELLHKNGFLKNQLIPKYYSQGKYDFSKKLVELQGAKILCTFFFNTEFSIGIVTEVNQKEFSIKNVAYDGTEDGVSVFDLTLLTKIRCETNFENRISFLIGMTQSNSAERKC